MKIRAAELVEIRLPLRTPFRTSAGVRSRRRILLLRLDAEGASGWGECVATEAPDYTYETTDTAWDVLTRHLLPPLPGLEVADPGDVLGPTAWIRGHPMARATVEMAAWDLDARLAGVPLARHLGGEATSVPVGVSVGVQADDEALLRIVEKRLERGYRRVKVKVAPGRDREPLRRIRERFGGDLLLTADGNAAYTLDDLPALKELDDFGLGMLEQPLAYDDFRDHARLQEALETPLCLDESLRSPRDVALALELESCRIVNLKPGRVGGLTAALEIHDLCRARRVPVWCGGMLESGIGRAHNLALATLPGFTLPGDLSESRRYWEEDVVHPPFVLDDDGRLPVPDGPGIGVEPRLDRIRERTVRRATFPS